MTTSAERMRGWTGPAILSFGFRPFFLMAGLWAAAAMALWVAMLAGAGPLRTAFDPFAWHAHEFVFGYVGAVVAGFLLTAVPNWTGRLPVVGWPLGVLALLWIAGRIAVALSAGLPWGLVLAADLALPVALILVLGREIVAGRNWRNLPVLGILALFAGANAVFHVEATAGGLGLRLGLAAILMLIALIGGRIVPSFTRNWLAQRRSAHLPVPPGRADSAVLALTGLALALFVIRPEGPVLAGLAAMAGVAHLWRLSRWQGHRTGAEPLVWVLHLAYAFLALGFLAVAAAAAGLWPLPAALHLWLAGAVGLMTLAVMTRASLGHAGRPLHAGPAVAATYIALAGAGLARPLAAALPAEVWPLHLAAGLWMAAFAGFAVIYWPILTRPRAAPRRPVQAGGPA